jgi:hypothetical protein
MPARTQPARVWLAIALGAAAGVYAVAPAPRPAEAGVAVFPLAYEQGSREPQAISPAGFVAHLVSANDRSVELVIPSGEWLRPKPGPYFYWLEGHGKISRHSELMQYSGLSTGLGMLLESVVGDAGRVTIPSGFTAPHLELRLLRAEDHLEANVAQLELSRRTPTTRLGDGVAMPIGKALAAVWDANQRRYVALSQPFEVQKERTVTAPLEAAPTKHAHLVALLERVRWARNAADYRTLQIRLQRAGHSVAPNVVIQMAERVYVIWYHLAPGAVSLEASTSQDRLVPQTVELRAGYIARVVANMQKPSPLPWERDKS